MKMYKYIDENIAEFKKQTQKDFNNSRLRLQKFDELNIVDIKSEVSRLFKKLNKRSREFYDGLVEYLSHELGFPKEKYDLEELLSMYSAVLLFSFSTEAERKQSRYFESLVSIGDIKNQKALENQKKNTRYWNSQVEEFGVDIEIDITIKEMKEHGIKKVRWVAMDDNKRCKTCDELHDQIFDIDDVPSRPHHGCRCTIEAVEGGDE